MRLTEKQELRPNYYRDSNGHDLFWEMEHGAYPIDWCIGFCQINADKYKRRLGKETKDTTRDRQKMLTYQKELKKMVSIKSMLDKVGIRW